MKKLFVILAVSSLVLYGCSGESTTTEAVSETETVQETESSNLQSQDIEVSEEISEESEEVTETAPVANEKPEESETEGSGDLQSEEQTVSEPVTETETETQLTDEASLRQEAISLVASDLGVGEDEMIVLVAEVEEEDGEVDLDVFYGGTIYEYEITNGNIDEKEGEIQIDQALVQELFIGRDAMQIAYDTAGITEADVVDYEISLDDENGMLYYDIEIDTANKDYEFTIDARTGEVLEQEIDG